jgi:hypothetical protein
VSWTTGTQTECLAANTAAGTSYGTFTAAQYIGAPGGSAYLPANFFPLGQGIGKALLIKAYGVLSTTGTPNLTLGVSLNTPAQGTYNSSGVLAVTAATTQSSGVTNVPWELEVLATCTATGSSGALLADGMVRVYPTGTSLIAARCSSSTANPNTALTISTEAAYYVELFAAWSASSASNAIQVYSVAVLGLN